MANLHSQKPPLVLVHGFRGAPIGLEQIAQDLQNAGYAAYLPAIPPCSSSSDSPDDHSPITYTADFYTQFLKDYCQKAHLDRPVLIGHSMGSVVCAATTHAYPELFHQKLILLSPIAGHTPKLIALISPLSALFPRRMIDYATTRYLFVPHNHQLFREVLNTTNLCSASQSPNRSDNLQAARFASSNCIDDFLPLQKHVLLLAGAKDRLIKQAKTIALAEKINLAPHASATTLFLPNTGHLHNYEQPHETAQAILNFLDNA